MPKNPANQTTQCPCDSGKPYDKCCQPYHSGTAAPTAEALMRSRYAAYVLKLENYLLKTWHRDTRPKSLDLANDSQTRWLGLEVKRHVITGDSSAMVEFIARYKIAGKAGRLHESSDFIQIDHQWYYIDGHHEN